VPFFSNAGRTIAWTALGLALSASPALANPAVTLNSAVYVERAQSGDVRVLEPASQLSRGDRIVTVVTWQLRSGNGGFSVTNPLPRGIYYQGSASGDEEVSVDGGRSWGKLGQLRLGNRMATPEDVTHVRWHVPATQAVAGRGNIAYSGIVR
jgi:hypothetical protein